MSHFQLTFFSFQDIIAGAGYKTGKLMGYALLLAV